MSENKKHIHKKVQGNYRRSKNQIRDHKDFDKKEFIILVIIILIIYFLNAIFPEFLKKWICTNRPLADFTWNRNGFLESTAFSGARFLF
ncbi:hypothetical protein ACQKMI_11310 [Lysinibacillus sp. NPDC097214]|uniref:hypothetical protein n=1 Tax=Lysinibacillus sp. NPDC097214 TaxID=3390584 RepID=UPI003D037937